MMKKIIVIIGILVGILIVSNVMGQVITIKVENTKKLLFDKNEDYVSFLYDPSNGIMGGIDINKNCKYVFDIENKKWNFFKNGVEYGFVECNSIEEKDGTYTITYDDNGLPLHEGTIVTQIFTVDVKNNYFLSAFHDSENPYRKVQLPKQYSIKVN